MIALRATLRFTLRSLFRETVRGHFFRRRYYRAIARNEHNAANLQDYVRSRALEMAAACGYDAVDPDDAINWLKTRSTLTKQEVRDHPDRLLSPTFNHLFFNHNVTSGTSGTPLRIKQSLECIRIEEAFVQRQAAWAGFKNGERSAWIRGELVVPVRRQDPPYWCRDLVTNTLLMSSFHISNASSPAYLERLETFEPVLIRAYPSSIAALALWLDAQDRDYAGTKLRAIITSSEKLRDADRTVIERRFGCRVYDWYGQGERVAAIGTCEYGRYHLMTDYSLVELAEGPDGACEIIGTSLNNVAMPLVRYATGDTVLRSDQPCECGRVFPVIDAINGRDDDVITLGDGRKIGRLDVLRGVYNVMATQIVHHRDDRFTIRIVPCDAFDSNDEAQILRQLRARVGDVEAVVERCTQIPRGAHGKLHFIQVESHETH